jgi:hypothetical protein
MTMTLKTTNQPMSPRSCQICLAVAQTFKRMIETAALVEMNAGHSSTGQNTRQAAASLAFADLSGVHKSGSSPRR